MPHPLSVAGSIGAYAEELGIELVPHVADRDGPVPGTAGFDLLLSMGSPWSVYGEEVGGWIEGALALYREAVDRRVPVLGICFGAQGFAQALGGEVFRGPATELGWATVTSHDPATVPEGPWFMWHSDAFTLPPGARLLAETHTGPQAYELGPHLCVQFHPEATPDVVRAWIDTDASDFDRLGLDPTDVLAETERRRDEAKRRARALFDRFLTRAIA
jgi:GMP synthase-like glutamine amidotransferase